MANRVNDTEQRATERLLLIGSVVLITSLAFEALATTNAMPTVVADLGGDRWYSLAAGMVLAGQIVSTTVAGWWADKSGVRTPLFLGLTMFSAGALAAGLAPNLAVFVLGRAIQGLGSGLVMVPLYVMVGAMVSADRRPMFFAAFSFAWVLPSMIGPFIAGYIVDHWDWRPVFWLIVPIALVALLPLGPIVKRMPNPQPQDVTPPASSYRCTDHGWRHRCSTDRRWSALRSHVDCHRDRRDPAGNWNAATTSEGHIPDSPGRACNRCDARDDHGGNGGRRVLPPPRPGSRP